MKSASDPYSVSMHCFTLMDMEAGCVSPSKAALGENEPKTGWTLRFSMRVVKLTLLITLVEDSVTR